MLAWVANWSVHATMALALPGTICGGTPAPSPDAPCPVCGDALAAGAGPVAILDVPVALATDEAPRRAGSRGRGGSERFPDAPARAPPRG